VTDQIRLHRINLETLSPNTPGGGDGIRVHRMNLEVLSPYVLVVGDGIRVHRMNLEVLSPYTPAAARRRPVTFLILD
jgi:hypothetical protein